MKTNHQTPRAKTTSTTWRALYIIGGIAALTAVLVFRRYFSVELMQFNGFGLFNVPDAWPVSALDWFALFQENPFVGLVLFDLFDLLNYGLLGLIFLALYGALRKLHKKAVLVATTLAYLAIAIYFVSNRALAMFNLSNHYAAATDKTQQVMILAAGETLLEIHNPGELYPGLGIFLSLFLLLLAGLIISIVMLRSEVFNKATAIVGVLANGFGLGFFISLPLMPDYSWIFPTISAPFRMVWYILIAIRLFQLGRANK